MCEILVLVEKEILDGIMSGPKQAIHMSFLSSIGITGRGGESIRVREDLVEHMNENLLCLGIGIG